jgi:hypothetical protein
MARRLTPDSLVVVRALVDEAVERAPNDDWRIALLHNARRQIDGAREALADGERALRAQRWGIARLMGKQLEARRQEIADLVTRIEQLEAEQQ